jgi:hypothetical protein
MTWRAAILLGALGLTVALVMAAFQSTPGYMDADAYYAVGRQLATGHGFTEMYLWNYLDDPSGIPHPSNAYWMPLASILAAAGAFLFGPESWSAARISFLVIAAVLPPLTMALAWYITGRSDLSITSGLLSVFPAFYMPFLSIPETFGPYILLGGLFFLILFRPVTSNLGKSALLSSFLLGLIAGLMHLTRADGLLWLPLAFAAVIFILKKPDHHHFSSIIYGLLLCLCGYLLIMAPWFVRNLFVFGAPLAPGSTKMLWLTSYDQLYAYPASQLTSTAWWESGLSAILKARIWALGVNLASILAVQWEVFLLPLVGAGFWYLRKDHRVQLAGVACIFTLGVMTIAFPFAGARGGYFHSGAALQTVWWALAPLGLERLLSWVVKKRGWNFALAGRVFRISLVGLAVVLTAVILWTRGQGWEQENLTYSHINAFLVTRGATSSDIVMVANPPGFYLSSGNASIAVPDGDIDTLLLVAEKYHATYLILERGSMPAGLVPVYNNPNGQSSLAYLREIENARIFYFPH